LPINKNDNIEMEITACTAQGDGIGHHEGMTVFVPRTAVGDVAQVHILKVKGSYAFGKLIKVNKPSPLRAEIDCPVYSRCGGCSFRHIDYEQELKIKQTEVGEIMKRIGHIDIEPKPIIGAKNPKRYRNKAQFPLSIDGGRLNMGFYAPHSHRVIDCRDCLLQPEGFSDILGIFEKWIDDFEISVYDEQAHRGILRHIYIRQARATGEKLICAVINGDTLPHAQELISELTKTDKDIKSIVININRARTNVILGEKCITLWGSDYITDILCSLKVRVSPLSFYQVNSEQAQALYEKAAEYAALSAEDILLDVYCGAGTIGLSMAKSAKQVIGIEIVSQAVEDAKINAEINKIKNARFICADAARAAEQLKKEGVKPNVIVVDPPRKGCSSDLLNTIARMNPARLVYISCNPATLARDCAILDKKGYKVKALTPVDMFPSTAHVETVVLMSRVKN
jgi:23S rRNA (uracil1939-C5)-methyltransferase